MIHEKNINQLKSEVQYIQEVGTPSLCGNDQSRFSKPHIFWLPSFIGSDFLPTATFISPKCPHATSCGKIISDTYIKQ